MIFIINAQNTNLITREDLSVIEWAEKLEKFVRYTAFNDDNELIKQLTYEYNLNQSQIEEIKKCLETEKIKYHRYSCTKYEHFKIEPVYLEIKKVTGKLIYWRDWDYIFEKRDNDYFLWCFLGGFADAQREIKLSEEHVKKYQEIGLAQIDYLIDNLKKLHNSEEYELAIIENRKVM
ncbi:med21 domain-containing protein [Flavobacterium sp. LS1R47]|uniref:Med21 domain-containing protein n=1 Tax=Flavobacterium frigoritolerans TaxID=2987686 RepID=A0A9X3CAB4_9FLAO|nr:med21 domain-containing protein [Flavobacterium frigoritolerans]MCV9934452.1 med21 domain-containing protein [Flavobacterium frigoritolerans]